MADHPYGTHREWALQIDCDVEGCDPHHSDHGRVLPHDPRAYDEPMPVPVQIGDAPPRHMINGHAARLLSRTVTVGRWYPPADEMTVRDAAEFIVLEGRDRAGRLTAEELTRVARTVIADPHYRADVHHSAGQFLPADLHDRWVRAKEVLADHDAETGGA